MFSAFQTFGKLGAIGKAIAAAWSPLALWPDGVDSPGMWIDPSLLTASFNDSTGTTPVAPPGSVADSANPVGLALDIRAGAPGTLGPELVTNGSFDTDLYGWITTNSSFTWAGGKVVNDGSVNHWALKSQTMPLAGKWVILEFDLVITGGFLSVCRNNSGADVVEEFNAGSSGHKKLCYYNASSTYLYLYPFAFVGSIDNISVREIPGNHMLQSTSAARPLESARVNLLTKTEDFSDSSWVKFSSCGVTSDAITAPDGSTTADKLVPANSTAQFGVAKNPSSSFACSYTYSVYLKQGEFKYAGISAYDGSSYFLAAAFDLSTGTVVSISEAAGTPLISSVGDGWYRCSVTGTSAAAFSGSFSGVRVYSSAPSSINVNCVGDGSSGLYAWGAQCSTGILSSYQRVNTASDYTATGFPQYLKFDGVDDALSSATFAAGTLTSSMDCLIAVRRDSAANAVCGLYESVSDANKVFGIAESGSSSGCVGSGAGTPTVWVDNTQLTGGTAVTRGTLHTALTAGAWHILEFRGLDQSTWTAAGCGLYTGYALNGAIGKIELFASGQDAARDKARARMAAYFGVTLP